jgi:CBS domain-containing protein
MPSCAVKDARTIEHTPLYERELAKTYVGVYRMSEGDDEGIVNLRVRDVMAREPVMVESERTVRETAIVMDRSGHGCLLVTSNGRIVGIITERDLVRRALAKGGGMTRTKVKNIMSSPLVVVDPDASVEEAARVMAKHKVRRLPVVGSGGLAGLITITDIAKYLAQQSENAPSIYKAMARSNGSRIYA